jgi:hypothetical protein
VKEKDPEVYKTFAVYLKGIEGETLNVKDVSSTNMDEAVHVENARITKDINVSGIKAIKNHERENP